MVFVDDHILRWADEADLEPHAILRAVRDDTGTVVDFVYREINDIACRQQQRPRQDLINRSVAETLPEVKRSGLLAAYARCVSTGEPLVLNDFSYYGQAIPGAAPDSATPQTRHYEVQVVPLPDDCISLRWRDTTERVEANRVLTDAEERYRLLAENSVDVVAHVGADGLIKWVSPSVEWTFGAPPSHWVGLPGMAVVAPPDAEGAAAAERRVLRGARAFQRVRTLDAQGGVHWSEANVQPFYNSDGTRDGYISFIRLVDDQVALERQRDAAHAAQAEADARYRQLIETSTVATALTSLEGRYTLVNPAMCELAGCDAETLLTMSWHEFFKAEDHTEGRSLTDDFIAGRIDSFRAKRQMFPRGSDRRPIWVDLSLSCIRSSDGEAEYLISQYSDITQEVEAQNLLRAAIDAMLDPQVLLQAVRDSDGQVVDFVYRQANDAACDYLGMSREELLGSRQLDTLPNLRESGLHGRYIHCLQTGEPIVLDDFAYFNEILHAPKRYDIRAARAGADALSLTWRDVTERAAERVALEQAHQLLRAATDAMLNPQAVVEAVQNPAGEVVDLLIRDVNHAFTDYLDSTRDDWINQSLLSAFPGADGAGLLTRYARCAVTGEPVILDDFPYFNEVLGQTRFYDIRGNQVRPGLVVLTLRDSTERVQATQRLANSERHFRLLSENVGDVVAHTGPDGIVRWVSLSVEKSFGAPAQAWVGRSIQGIVVPEDLPNAAEAIIAADSGAAVHRRIRVFGSGGAVHWVEFTANRFVDAEGQPDGYVSSFRLIDAEVAAEKQAAETRARQARADALYRRLFDNSAVGVCLISPDGIFVEVNAAVCEFFGFDAATLRHKTWQELTAPAYLDADLEKVNDVKEGRIEGYRILKQYIHADGHLIWGDLSVSCIRDDQGRVEHFVSQISDASADVHARERLATSEEHYRLLALNATDAVLHVRDGIAVWVSPAIEEILGAPPKHWIGTKLRDVVPPEDIPAFEERWAMLDAGGEVTQRVRVVSVDGVTHWVHLHAKPFIDAGGRRDGVSAALRLIDDEVAAEAELAEARARQAAADALHRRSMESAAVGMCLASPEGPLIEVNQAFCDFFGYDAETMLTKTWIELTAPECRDADLANVAEMLAGRIESYQMDKQFLHADGHRIWGHLAVGCVRNPDGSVPMSIGQIIDITAEVEARQANEQARRELAELSAFYNQVNMTAAVGGCMTRPDGTFISVNPAMCDFFGYDGDTMQKKSLAELTAVNYQEADRQQVADLLAGRIDSYQLVKQYVHADGHTIWGNESVACIRGSGGQIDTLITQIVDITDEVEARAQLEVARRRQDRAQALYRRSVENAAVGMCLAETGGRFVEVNDAMCRFFGYDADTLKQKTWQDLTAPDYLQADLDRVEEMLAGHLDSYRTLKQFIHADGHRIWGDLSASCIRDAEGYVEQFIGQIVDVTESVEANQRNVILSEKLSADLHSAATYMASIMPTGLAGAVTVSSRYLPSQELGGDCFDYSWIDDDHLMVYLIDVSGHGIEPALLAVSLQNLLRTGAFSKQTLLNPTAVLTQLNQMFQMEQQADHFFTIFYGVYQRSTRTLLYGSAGAPPAYALSVSSVGGVRATPLITDGLPVGVLPNAEFSTESLTVAPGCRMLIVSDGASELSLGGDDEMSQERFESLLTQVAGSGDWSLDDLLEALRNLITEGTFEDDVSMIQLAFD